MREILFKAKRIDNGEWLEGLVTKIENTFCLIREYGSNISYECDVNTLCQYTGLTDKNGNKIWENDVVKKHFYTDYDACANSEEYTGKVEYLDFAWCITFEENKHKCVYPIFMAVEFKDAEYYEVIGNIFDNPELLKGSE
jgi:uncharacterized phage protein (TIGR01671 family)